MCLNPIHIHRKETALTRISKVSDIHTAPSYDNVVAYDVPCGKCEECLQQKRDEIFVRVWHEYNKCNQSGIFVTLTYNDSHIPLMEECLQTPIWLHDPVNPYAPELVQEPIYNMVTVWHKPHVQKFLKQLNEKLIYHVGTEHLNLQRLKRENGKRFITQEWKDFLKSIDRPIKYLVTCERGKSDIYRADNGRTRKGTSRPHYHAILLITNTYLQKNLNVVFRAIKDLWIYGYSYNIKIKDKQGTDLRSPSRCIEYVCKYITKDLGDITSRLLYRDYENERCAKPFCLLSHGLGESLLDNYKNLDSVIKNGIPVPSSKKPRSVNVPRYNLKKRLEYTIKGTISTDKLTRLYNGVYYDSGHSAPFYFIWDEDLPYVQPKKHNNAIYTKIIKTDECKQIEINNRIRKANFYASELSLYQNSLNLIEVWNITKTPLVNRNFENDMDLLKSVTPDEMYLFILNDLYINDDQYYKNDTMFQVYELIRMIRSTFKIIKYRKRQLEYKLNLTKALQKKPELFSCKPL